MSDPAHTGPDFRPGGRRVLFVDPPSVIQEQMIHFLITAQFEAAIVKDPRRIQPILRKFPGSVVYFNIDSKMPPSALEQIVRGVMNSQGEHYAEIGILSYNENREYAQRYLMELGVRAGYITLNIGFEKSARIIMRALEATEARGKRRFVRVKAPAGKAYLGINLGGSQMDASILDISEAGTACIVKGDLGVGTYLPDIQLRLWGTLCRATGAVRGTRESPEGRVSVIMFEEALSSDTRRKIYSFLKRVMQYEVEPQ